MSLGMAKIVYCTRQGDVVIGGGSVLYYEPGIDTVQVSLPYNMRVSCYKPPESAF
jgi:hypothetical protein